MQNEGSPKKPVFSDPPDHDTAAFASILASMHQQETQILSILSKYQDVLPGDEHATPRESKGKNNIIKSRSKLNNSRSNKKEPRKLRRQGLEQPQQNKYIINGMTKNSKSQAQDIIEDKMQQQTQGNNRKQRAASLELPQVHNRPTIGNSNRTIDYGMRVSERGISIQPRRDSILQIVSELDHHGAHNRIRIKSSVTGNLLNQRASTKTEAMNQRVNKLELISSINSTIHPTNRPKPIRIQPYSIPPSPEHNSTIKKYKLPIESDSDDDGGPADVSLAYYAQTLNDKFKQQCEEQMNYLFFSKSEHGESNKQWVEGIEALFRKHDREIDEFHASMRYLEAFDEGYFASGIYSKRG